MPFLAPAAAAIGSAFAALTASAIGSALVGAALSIGLSVAAQALAPEPDEQVRGVDVDLTADAAYPRTLIMGRQAVGGSLVYRQAWGPNNRQLDLVIALADHEIAGIHEVWVDDEIVTIDPGGNVTEYRGDLPSASYMAINFRYGTIDQGAFQAVIDHSGGRWTSDHRCAGVALAYVRLTYNEELYPHGVPKIMFVVNGAKLYDRRKDTTNGGTGAHRWGTPSTYEWSENATLAVENYYRGVYTSDGVHLVFGMGVANADLDAASCVAAHNVCDESVSLVGGGSEARYRIGASIASTDQHGDNLKALLAASNGEVIDQGGVIAIHAGAARLSVASITDDDLLTGHPVTINPSKPRSEILNAVYALYTDPGNRYDKGEIPKRTDASYVSADGGVTLATTLDLGFVTSGTQAQRIAEIVLKKARIEDRVQIPLRRAVGFLEPGDWLTWTSARYGYTTQTFQVIAAEYQPDLSILATLQRVNASAWGWNYQTDEEGMIVPPALDRGGPLLTTTVGWDASVTTVTNSNGETVPGILMQWTPFSDATIDDDTVIGLLIEYRKAGDVSGGSTVRFTTRTPNDGSIIRTEGVVSNTIYEARSKPITRPARVTEWTGWDSTATATGTRLLPAGSIEIDRMVQEARERFEQLDRESQASLAVALDDVRTKIREVANLAAAGIAREMNEKRKIIRHTEDRYGQARAAITLVEEASASAREALAAQQLVLQAQLDAIDLTGLASAIDAVEVRVTQTESGIDILGTDQEALILELYGPGGTIGTTSRIDSAEVTLSQHGSDIALNATDIDAVQAELPNKASVTALNTQIARIDANESDITVQGSDITGIKGEIYVNGDPVQGSVIDSMQVDIAAHDGVITNIEAQRFIGVNANGTIGGIWIGANGTTSTSIITLSAGKIVLDGEVVFTQNIGATSVQDPKFVSTTFQHPVGQGTWVDVVSVTISTTSETHRVDCFFSIALDQFGNNDGGASHTLEWRLLLNNTPLDAAYGIYTLAPQEAHLKFVRQGFDSRFSTEAGWLIGSPQVKLQVKRDTQNVLWNATSTFKIWANAPKR